MAIVKKELNTVTVYHGNTPHVDTIADTPEMNYGGIALTSFLHGLDIIHDNTYIPYGAICHIEVTTDVVEIDVDDKTCQSDDPTPGQGRIDGANNVTIRQGEGIDLAEGVTGYDAEGNEIPFTYSPETLDECEVGHHTVTYTAGDVTKERIVTITQLVNPTIHGISEPIEVEVNEEFDPLDGVTATDGNGNEATVTVEEPEQYVIMVDVSNYTAPNSTPTQTISWQYEALEYEVEGVLADGAPATVTDLTTENDTTIYLHFDDDFVVALHDGYGTFTSTVGGNNPPNEVTFERLIIKYPEH